MSLFKQERPKRALRVCRVENLNPKEGVSMSYNVSKDQREHIVCLCLPSKTVKTRFTSESSAFEQMRKYRDIYKKLGDRH